MEEIGLKIKRLREEQGLSQTEFATRLGLKRQTVNGWESGRYSPTLSKLSDVARVLGITVDELIESKYNFSISNKQEPTINLNDPVLRAYGGIAGKLSSKQKNALVGMIRALASKEEDEQ